MQKMGNISFLLSRVRMHSIQRTILFYKFYPNVQDIYILHESIQCRGFVLSNADTVFKRLYRSSNFFTVWYRAIT